MFPLMDEYEKGGLSKVEFCKQRAIPIAVFWYWYRKYRDQEDQASNHFVELEQLPLTDIKMEVEIGDLRIMFREFPPVDYLQDIARLR